MTFSIEAWVDPRAAEPTLITTAEQVDELIDTLLADSGDYSIAALYVRERPRKDGYPDHDLRVAADKERGVGGLRWGDMSNPEFADVYAGGQPEQHDEVLYAHMGNPMHFPLDSELPIEEVRAAVKELLHTGDRPTSLTWVQWPEDLRD